MAKSSVYTRKGDKGHTSLVDGKNVSKADPIIESYGEVDELNSWMSAVRVGVDDMGLHAQGILVERVQHKLFDLGSNLACQLEFREKYQLPQIGAPNIKELEDAIDQMDGEMPKLKNFILPGATGLSSRIHVARTVCRRVERRMSAQLDLLPPFSLEFINRLSDYLFVLARYADFKAGKPEIIWKKI